MASASMLESTIRMQKRAELACMRKFQGLVFFGIQNDEV